MRGLLFIPLFYLVFQVEGQETIRVGAKHFNEGYILSEMIAQVLEDGEYKVERKFNLGGSTVTFASIWQPVGLKGNRLQNNLAGAYLPAFHRQWNNHWLENRAEG